jgi:hypothetical protein
MQPERKNISGWKSLPFFMGQHTDDPEPWGYLMCGESGKPFVTYAGAIITTKGETANFMHELGHNLNLEHTPNTYPGYGPVPMFADTCMRTGISGLINYVDYHEVEWKVVKDNIDPW